MSDPSSTPQAEEVAPAVAEPKSAAAEPVPAEVVPSEEPNKGADDLSTSAVEEEQVKAESQEPAVAEPAGDASVEKTTAPEQAPADETAEKRADEVSTNNDVGKGDDMMAEPIETNEANKTTAEEDNSEVKMDTSTTEEKTSEEKPAVTSNSPAGVPSVTSETNTQPPTAPSSQVAENKELVADVKPTAQEQTQPPKTQQEQMPTRQYLNATVVPILHSALSQLAKTRPEDPIQFLGQYLLQYKETFTQEQK